MSLENVLLDVRELGKGMDLIRRECSLHDHSVLKGFVQASDAQLDKIQKDAKTAEVPQRSRCDSGKNRRGASWLPALRPLCFLTRDSSTLSPFSSPPLPGGLQQRGELLRGERQDGPALGLLPRVCALHQGLQGEQLAGALQLSAALLSGLLGRQGFGLLVVIQPARGRAECRPPPPCCRTWPTRLQITGKTSWV